MAVLKLLSEPDGLKKILAELKGAHDQTVTALNQADQKHQEMATVLADQRQEQATREQDLADRDAKLRQQQNTLDGHSAMMAGREATLAEAKSQLLSLQQEFARDKDLLEQAKINFEKAQTERISEVEAALAARLTQAAERENAALADIVLRQAALDKQQAALVAAQQEIDGKSAEVKRRETIVQKASDTAAKLKAECEEKLAGLRHLIGG